jgi:hypothetical protein
MDLIELSWKEYAEACALHDAELGHHALEALIPEQRKDPVPEGDAWVER